MRRGTHASFLIWGEWQVSRPLWRRNMHYCCPQRLKLDFVYHFYRVLIIRKQFMSLIFYETFAYEGNCSEIPSSFQPIFYLNCFLFTRVQEQFILSIWMNSYWAFEWTLSEHLNELFLIEHSNELLLWGILGHLDKPINPSWRRGKQKIVYYSLDLFK